MPHVVLEGELDPRALADTVDREAVKWGAAVLKTEELWIRSDGRAVLAAGVVVEHARPQHPVAVISRQRGETSSRLWRLTATERTPAVQRWLAGLAAAAQAAGCGPVVRSNLGKEITEGLGLVD